MPLSTCLFLIFYVIGFFVHVRGYHFGSQVVSLRKVFVLLWGLDLVLFPALILGAPRLIRVLGSRARAALSASVA